MRVCVYEHYLNTYIKIHMYIYRERQRILYGNSVYMYIHTHLCIPMCIHIYIHNERDNIL